MVLTLREDKLECHHCMLAGFDSEVKWCIHFSSQVIIEFKYLSPFRNASEVDFFFVCSLQILTLLNLRQSLTNISTLATSLSLFSPISLAVILQLS